VAQELAQTVFGQEEACMAMARMVTRLETGLVRPDRPVGVVMFLGPTGVGKTEMARALSKKLFGKADTDKLLIVNCAEFSEKHTISRILGSAPSYVGYGDDTLIDHNFLSNRNILVFDEIEKANPALWRVLLSVFASGVLNIRSRTPDGAVGEIVLNFSNSFIILTSNVGAYEIHQSGRKVGFPGASAAQEDVSRAAIAGLKAHFGAMPEFLARIDEMIVFKPLEDRHYEQIYWKFIDELNEALADVGVYFTTSVELTRQVISLAVKNKQYGARDMEHTIKTSLLQPLADVLAIEPDTDYIVGDLDEKGEVVFFMRPGGKKNISEAKDMTKVDW